jgi:hypothetical protein
LEHKAEHNNCDSPDDLEHQATAGRGQIKVVAKTDEGDSERLQFSDRVDEVADRKAPISRCGSTGVSLPQTFTINLSTANALSGTCPLTFWGIWSRLSEWSRTGSVKWTGEKSSRELTYRLVDFDRATTPKYFKANPLIIRVVCHSQSFVHVAAVLCGWQEHVKSKHFLGPSEVFEDREDENHFAQ